MPLIEYSFDTINYDLKVPSPSPPSSENLLGTDDQGRDVLARLIYGFRISVFFGLTLTILSSVIGILAGGIQGFYGGKIGQELCSHRSCRICGEASHDCHTKN